MMYRDLDKQVIKENSYTVLSKITLLNDGTVYTEEDSIIDWNYEDYRYVPDTGFVGQFVERLLDGNLQDIPDDKIFENQEINLQIGIVNGIDDITTWYDYGNFLITKVEETDTSGNYKFESSDYTKKFNQVYEDTIAYPCLSLDLANNVCGQVDITMDTKGNADYYIVGEEGLSAGDYAFKVGTTYYKFTTTSDLVKNDVLMLIEYYNRLYVKTVRYDEETGYTVTRTFLTFTTGDTVGDYSLLTTRSTGYVDFTNNDFVIENNQYEEQDTCRKVMQDIGKLAYSWVRIGTDNKLYIDFNQMSQASVDDYDKLTTNEYYVSKKQDLYYGPVNKVLIGMSSVDGENLYETSEDYTEETECAIKIYDNNLTYTEELRAIALKGCERLFGLTYMPLEIETIGHPWLEGNELIKLTNLDGEELYTYPFNRSIKYSGYIEGNISSEAATIKNTEYEYESNIINQINRTSITVDKNNQTITSLVSQVGDAESNITELQQTTTSLTATVEHLDEEYEQNVVVRRDAEGNPIEVEDAGNYPLEDFKIYGNCEQDGEPSTSNPVEVQTVTSKTTTVDYEGTNIDIDSDYDTNLIKTEKSDLEVEGNTYQKQTTQGKNLFDKDKTHAHMANCTKQVSGNTIVATRTVGATGTAILSYSMKVEKNTNYVVTGTAIVENTSLTGGCMFLVRELPNGGTVISNNQQLNITTTDEQQLSLSFNSGNYTEVYLWFYVDGSNTEASTTGTRTITYKNIQFEKGTSATSYEAFVPDSPSPDYPSEIQTVTGNQEIEVVGKNLYDTTYRNANGNILSANCSVTVEEDEFVISTTGTDVYVWNVRPINNYYNRDNGKLYEFLEDSYVLKISDNRFPNTYITYYDKNKKSLGYIHKGSATTTISKNDKEGAKYFTIRFGSHSATSGQTYRLKLQLEKGSTATEYEPYIANKYEVNLGKNLLNIPNGTYSNHDVTAVVNNGIITLNGTANGNSYININLGSNIRVNGEYYTYSINNAITSTTEVRLFDTNNSYTSLSTSTANNKVTKHDIRTYNLLSIVTTSGVSLNNFVIKPQLEKGGFATNFSPYFTPIELCKINDYKDRIFKGKGYNLLNVSNYSGRVSCIVNQDGSVKSNINNEYYCELRYTYLNDYFLANKGKTFTYSMANGISGKTMSVVIIGTRTGGATLQEISSYTGENHVTFTIADDFTNITMVYFRFNRAGTPFTDTTTKVSCLQLVEGSSVLPYEPYLAKDKWYIEKKIGKVVLNGSESGWYFEGQRYKINNIIQAKPFSTFDYNNPLAYSNYFKWGNGVGNVFVAGAFWYLASGLDLSLQKDQNPNATTLANFKTWLSTHNTIVYYVLATPTYTEITDTTLINELESVSNFTLYSPLTHYTTTSEYLSVISKFSVSTLPYEVISITDENDNKLTFKPLFRNLELCKIGDYIDYLYLKQGKWYKHEEIGKILSYNGETITTDYISTTGELSMGATVYYVLQDTKEIEITDEEITEELNRLMQNPIYKGYNEIYLNDPVCEKLTLTYLTDSILNDTYASKAQLSMTNNSISALVQTTDSLESNLANLEISVDGISTAVESVETVTTNLENSINYLAVDMSANSLIIPTNEENKPYLTNTYIIPFTATFKGTSVNPTVTTSSASITGITLTFGTGVINVGVSSATAIANVSNSFVINFSYTNDGQTYVVSKTLNVALSVKGEDGKDGTSVTILGSYNTLADLQAAHPTGNAGDSYMVGNDLYVWNVASLAWVDVGQIKGTDGINSYIYIRYSENPDGNPMVTTPTSTTQYIGVVTTTSSTAPTSYGSYTWSKYAGNNGETTYLHIKYSEDGSTFVPASADAGEGDTPSAWVGVLTDTNEEASDEFDDYTWYKFTEDIDDDLLRLQNDIVQNASDIDSNYKAIMKNFDSYVTADTVATLKSRVETLETDDAYAINIIRDLQVNGVSQVRTEKGFTFNDSGMTIDATNSVTKSVTDTNGITVLDKSGSSQSELLFAGYDETSQSSVVRTENLKVRKFLTIGTYSRLEDYEDGTGVFDV